MGEKIKFIKIGLFIIYVSVECVIFVIYPVKGGEKKCKYLIVKVDL